MVKRHDLDSYVEVSAKTGEGVKEIFDSLPPKIAEKQRYENAASAIKDDYKIRITSTARNNNINMHDVLCCNIF